MNNTKAQLAEIVGQKNVVDDPETLETYAHDESFSLPIRPCIVTRPRSANEVQAIVKWANHTQTALVPVSSGPPRFRGDTVPSAAAAAMVDLSAMKQIIRIDRRNRVAIIEPGVTYSELQSELAREGMRLSMPLLPRANKSVVTSLLEREPILIPRYQWTALEPLRSLEVVWGDGEKFRTGDPGNWSSFEEAWKKKLAPISGAGPAQTDFWRLVSAAQGSMGIVTWVSVKCELLPQIHKLYFVPSKRLEDLIHFVYRLLRFRFGDELLILNNFTMAAIMGGEPDRMRTAAAELPPWAVLVGIAGRDRLPEERVKFQENDISDMAQQFGLRLTPEISGARNSEMLNAIRNPSREPYWKQDFKGGNRDIFFVSTLDRTPEFVKTMQSAAEACQYPASEVGVYLQPMHQGASCHCEFNLYFDRNSSKETARIRNCFTQASEAVLGKGAFFSRPYGIWAHMAFNRDAQSTAVLKQIKTIFDPMNVMNPGKLCF